MLLYLKIRLDEDSVLVSGLAKVCFLFYRFKKSGIFQNLVFRGFLIFTVFLRKLSLSYFQVSLTKSAILSCFKLVAQTPLSVYSSSLVAHLKALYKI